ncbi:MAG: hypothetical protein ACFFC7_27085 [Candidatus Hermodarchaeota archaeon]
MEYIVIYEKRENNPIVAIEPKLIIARDKIEDYFPHLNPRQFGFVIVPEEIISYLEIVEYEKDKKGKTVFEPVFCEVQKKLFSKFDSAFDANILIFGQKITALVSIVDLKDKSVKGSVVDPEKGIIDIGDNKGFFTVTCRTVTGKQPKIKSRKKNWKWIKSKGDIIGIELLKKKLEESKKRIRKGRKGKED